MFLKYRHGPCYTWPKLSFPSHTQGLLLSTPISTQTVYTAFCNPSEWKQLFNNSLMMQNDRIPAVQPMASRTSSLKQREIQDEETMAPTRPRFSRIQNASVILLHKDGTLQDYLWHLLSNPGHHCPEVREKLPAEPQCSGGCAKQEPGFHRDHLEKEVQ